MQKIEKVLFMGSKRLGLRVLQKLQQLSPAALIGAMTIDDRSDTRSVFPQFKAFTASRGIALHVARNRQHAEETIRHLTPDLCFVVGWYWLISPETLAAVPHGFLGIHYSLLPKYRGGAPLVWQIINHETEAGASLFSFADGLDDGDIWARWTVPIGPDDYVQDVLDRLEEKTISALRETYPMLLAGRIQPVPQAHASATYCALRLPEDGNIDWRSAARDVYAFIRAQSRPYPGAFTYYGTRKLIIWTARRFPQPYFGTPGQVARPGRDGVVVVCGDHRAILLDEVEYDGTTGPAAELIKSIRARFSAAPVARE